MWATSVPTGAHPSTSRTRRLKFGFGWRAGAEGPPTLSVQKRWRNGSTFQFITVSAFLALVIVAFGEARSSASTSAAATAAA